MATEVTFTVPDFKMPQMPWDQFQAQQAQVPGAQVQQPAEPAYQEPWIRPGDIAAAVVGLLAKDLRIVLWGAAVADVVGRQVSPTFRSYSYQYVHRFFNF